MTTNIIKLFCSTFAFGAASTALAVAVAISGMFLIGLLAAQPTTTQKVAIAYSGASR